MTPEKLKEAQEYIDFVKTNLEPLASHLKVSVEWLWQILVNQVRVEAIVYLAVIVLMTIKAAILLTIAFKSMKKATFERRHNPVYVHKTTGVETSYYNFEDYGNLKNYNKIDRSTHTNMHGYLVYWCGIGGAILMLLTTITSATVMPKIVTGLVNPQYGAIERIVQFSKGKIPSEATK